MSDDYSRAPAAGVIAACPDEETLIAWFERGIADDARASVEAHLERCDDCRALVIEIARTSCETAEAPARGAIAPLTVGARVGRHVVLDWLGAGGMGVVYAAFDPELDRRVALKLLHPDPSTDDAGTKDALLREAQALARVSHPNVVTIYDVGAHEGHVFVSMEYVHGETLAEWLRREPRPPRAILARFLDAARGLAAAHAVDLVHRDFKPSNVLVGLDARVRVTDFGLACLASTDAEAPPARAARSWKGTPAYMSPEQQRGEHVDARSDQYSFCVALHEAIHGELPGRGSNDAPSGGVSARVRRAIQRGLSGAPSERFPTMDALIAALAPEQKTSRWPLVLALALGGAALGALAVGAWARAHQATAPVCAGAERKLAGVWDDDRKRAVSAAFAATKAPYAGDAWREVERTVDAYAARWVAMHTQACLATRVSGEQSEALLDLRVGCLDGEARGLAALSELFAHADVKTVELAAQAVHGLPALETCADAVALRARVPPSTDPAVKAEVERTRASLDRAVALTNAGRSAAARVAAEPLLEAAKKTGDRSLEARVDLDLGNVRMRLGDMSADAAYYDAEAAAESAGDDIVKARALIMLTVNLAEHEAKYDEAARSGGLALAVLSRLPSEVVLLTAAEMALSIVDAGKGHYAEGLARNERARELREKVFGPDDYLVALACSESATQLLYLGQAEKALAYWQRTAAIFERTIGGHHPQLGVVLRNVALAEQSLRRLDESLRDLRRAREIWREVNGDEHPFLPDFDAGIAETLLLQGRLREAKDEADRAVSGADRLHTPELILIDILNIAGSVDAELGHFEEATATLTRVMSPFREEGTPEFQEGTPRRAA